MGLKLGRNTTGFLFLKDHTGSWEENELEEWRWTRVIGTGRHRQIQESFRRGGPGD